MKEIVEKQVFHSYIMPRSVTLFTVYNALFTVLLDKYTMCVHSD